MLPAENLADVSMETVSEMDVGAEMTWQGRLYTQALQGRPEQAEGSFVLEQWQFPFRQDSIIKIVENPAYENGFKEKSITIVAERKDRADGLVEIINYATETTIEGFDFSDKVRPHQAALQDNVLQITGPQRLEVVLGMFCREFAASQILGEDTAMLERGASSINTRTVPGSQLLYLRIPADMEVQADIPVVYVED